jgi:hypothetical protein
MPSQNKKSKAQAIRDYIAEHKRAATETIIKALADQGVEVDAKYISKIKSMKKKQKPKSKSKGSATAKTSPGKGKPWTFARNTLEEAIRIPKAIEEKNAGNPMRASELAKAVGFRLANDWRFLDLLRSANQYGLVSGAGQTATVHIENLGQNIVAPGSPTDRQQALLASFNNVPDFTAVAKFYGDKKIPEDEFFINTLSREFKIPKDRVETFADVFVTNLAYLRAFDVVKTEPSAAVAVGEEVEKPTIEKRISKKPRVREFLDTCFVMMPFGDWFDKYYQDIYVPAIKEAGFEPVRADELFSTGTVVEQIWEQILKARVLLADLTDKSANVFYELGLAHAAKKPVVFTAPRVEDVPFDLRHLRIIIYEIREPEWASTLQSSVTDYLKNAMKDPEKSIPHPFRGEPEE